MAVKSTAEIGEVYGMSQPSALHMQYIQIYKDSVIAADLLFFKCMYIDARAPFHIAFMVLQKIIITEDCRLYFLRRKWQEIRYRLQKLKYMFSIHDGEWCHVLSMFTEWFSPWFAHRVAQLDIALHKVIYFALTRQMRCFIRSRELTWGFRMLKLGIFLSCHY